MSNALFWQQENYFLIDVYYKTDISYPGSRPECWLVITSVLIHSQKKKGTKAVTGAVPLKKGTLLYILAPEMYILAHEMDILAPEMDILAPEMDTWAHKMYILTP